MSASPSTILSAPDEREESKRTPTVVKTSCNLLTSVIKPGSLTLILENVSCILPMVYIACAYEGLAMFLTLGRVLIVYPQYASCFVRNLARNPILINSELTVYVSLGFLSNEAGCPLRRLVSLE